MAYVSDHAVLRYLERHCGIDIEAVRQRMTVRGIDTAAAFGCDTVILGDGARLKLKGCLVATCLESRKSERKRTAAIAKRALKSAAGEKHIIQLLPERGIEK